MFELMVVPLGATTAGYFVLVCMIVHRAFSRCEPWADWTVIAGPRTWFVLDSRFGVLHGAEFDVWMVDVSCFVVMGVPLVMLSRAFRHTLSHGEMS